MIVIKPEKRINADALSKRAWISRAKMEYNKKIIGDGVVQGVLENMRNLKITFQLQRAALLYCAKVFMSKQEKIVLKSIFDTLDEARNGEIDA